MEYLSAWEKSEILSYYSGYPQERIKEVIDWVGLY
jgi:hypothetical protein